MVFHPQEFGNVATCCAYLEGAGLGPGAAVARSDGVAWRRVSINYSHNYSRRPAASRCSPSPPTSAAIRIPNWTQRWWWDARSKGVCVCVYRSTVFIRHRGEASSSFDSDERSRDATFFDRGLEPIEPSDRSRGTSCNVIMTNSMEKGWGKSVKIRVLQWFSMVSGLKRLNFVLFY